MKKLLIVLFLLAFSFPVSAQIVSGGGRASSIQTAASAPSGACVPGGSSTPVRVVAGTLYICSTTTNTWVAVSGGTGLTDPGSNGILARIGAGTLAPRIITGTAGRVGVTNGDGVAGNPVIDLLTTAVTPGAYTSANITVDAYGRITAAANGSGGGGSVASVFGRTGTVVAVSGDYTWAQIEKTVSSLADLTTRSASDLNSGSLALARITALTASRAVVSDAGGLLSASATTSTEIGYLSGVTSAIQTQMNAKQASDATLTALAGYNADGILVQTAADTFAGRSIAVGAGMGISNANGVAGNPTISLGSSVVTSAVNDTNVIGSIASNTLTLGWTGNLSAARGGLGQSAATNNGVPIGDGTAFALSVIPNCANGTTDKLLYNSTTKTFTCGSDQTSGGGGGIGTLNALTAGTQTFSRTNDTNVTLTVTSSGSDHNFALGWTGTLANARLANSAITIAGTATALGGAITLDTITGLSATGIIKRTTANTLAIAASGTDYAPATSGGAILYGNGAGGFSSVTIGSGLSFASGTLSATGGGGTTINATDGAIPYRLNSTTFTDSPLIRISGTELQSGAALNPNADNSLAIGATALRWGGIHTGPTTGLVVHNDATDTAKVSLAYVSGVPSLSQDTSTNLYIGPAGKNSLLIGGTSGRVIIGGAGIATTSTPLTVDAPSGISTYLFAVGKGGNSAYFRVDSSGQISDIGGSAARIQANSGKPFFPDGLVISSIFSGANGAAAFFSTTGNPATGDAQSTWVSDQRIAYTTAYNDSNVGDYFGYKALVTLNGGVSNANKTLCLVCVDTTNTSVTGYTTTLAKLAYGGTERLRLDSDGTFRLLNGTVNFNSAGYLTAYPGSPTDGQALVWSASNSRWQPGTVSGGGGSLTVEEADGTPSIAAATTLRFDQADGLVVTNPGGSIARVDLTAVPNAALANSAVTIGSTSVSLGATAATIAGLTLTTPTIASFANAGHTHADAAGGEQLNASNIFSAGTVPLARISGLTNTEIASGAAIALSKLAITGTPDGTKFLRDDGSWQTAGGATINATDGVIPARLNSTTFTDTALSRNGTTSIGVNTTPSTTFAAFMSASTTATVIPGVFQSTTSASAPTLVAWMGSSQTADAFQVQNSSTTVLASIDVDGDIKPRNVAYTWPSANATGTLRNNGSGTLSWTDRQAVWLEAARCSTGPSAWTEWNQYASNNPTAACVTGSNTTKGVLDFPDSDGDYAVQRNMVLLPGFSGTVSVTIKWLAASTTGNVVWQVSCACAADNESDDPSWNTASIITDAAKGTANRLNDATATLTSTGCAAGEFLHVRLLRNRTHASDDLSGAARFVGMEVVAQ